MERKSLYKHVPESVESMRQQRRWAQNELRKEKRELVLSGKRMRVGDDDEIQDYDICCDEVTEAAKKLISKSGDRQNLLKFLRQAFTQGTALIDSFLKVENSLSCLVGIFTGLDSDLQLASAWCLTNISAGTDEHSAAVIKAAGPYLITYLTSGNIPLQDQCAWAIGNLAGGSASCRQVLRVQGALAPLTDLIQCPVSSVVQSAAFALSNLAKDEEAQRDLIKEGIIPRLASRLHLSDALGLVSEVGWILTYLSSSGKYTEDLLSAGILKKVMSLITDISQKDNNNFLVLTPLLRCFGNFICNIADADEICKAEGIIQAIGKLLESKHLHICKESLWVISNVSVFEAACDVILAVGLLPRIVSLLSSTFDIRKEAAFSLCNIAAHGNRFCSELHESGVLPGVIPLLKSSDPEACHLALSIVEMILHYKPEQAAKEFEESQGLVCLEALEYSSNEKLRIQTNDLLEMYFYKESNYND